MTEFAEIVKCICLIRDKTVSTFIKAWKPFMDFLLKIVKNEQVISGVAN